MPSPYGEGTGAHFADSFRGQLSRAAVRGNAPSAQGPPPPPAAPAAPESSSTHTKSTHSPTKQKLPQQNWSISPHSKPPVVTPPNVDVVGDVELLEFALFKVVLAVLLLEAFVEAALLVIVPPSGLLVVDVVFVVEFAEVVVVRVAALEVLAARDVVLLEAVAEPVSDAELAPPPPLTGPT